MIDLPEGVEERCDHTTMGWMTHLYHIYWACAASNLRTKPNYETPCHELLEVMGIDHRSLNYGANGND